MPTDMTDMTDSDSSDALKLSQRPNLAASSAAMKNVLSPISDTNIREKAAGKPDLPSCDLATYSCTTRRLVQLLCLDMPAALQANVFPTSVPYLQGCCIPFLV